MFCQICSDVKMFSSLKVLDFNNFGRTQSLFIIRMKFMESVTGHRLLLLCHVFLLSFLTF
jgi:hypothetical protein